MQIKTYRIHDCGQKFETEEDYDALLGLREYFVAVEKKGKMVKIGKPKRFIVCPTCGRQITPLDCRREVVVRKEEQ